VLSDTEDLQFGPVEILPDVLAVHIVRAPMNIGVATAWALIVFGFGG
jgi:hypothetical protein